MLDFLKLLHNKYMDLTSFSIIRFLDTHVKNTQNFTLPFNEEWTKIIF